MLSAESAATVRATLPVVAESMDDITGHFYGTMFADHPELLDGTFNRANQANGEQRKALAGSIAAFAAMLLDNPGRRPDALLSRIAHKHVSLGITDDQYVIVHKYLFGAIAHVLGEAATPDVVAAWDEVYWLMAGTLIAQEARLYARSDVDEGDVWREWEVVGRNEDTADVASFTLRPVGGGPVPPVRPGQFVSVRTSMSDGVRQARQYSVSGGGDGRLRITVKRVDEDGAPAGEMSTLLHTAVAPGDTLALSLPAGDVTLADGDHPVVLVSAGIGCTPMVAMLHHLAETAPDREVLVLHADRSPGAHALRDETASLVDGLGNAGSVLWYEEDADGAGRPGRMNLAGVEVPAGAEVYLCGPLPFMRAVRAQLAARGVPGDRIHYEVFGPDLWRGEE
ncbi:globin domain-containing protein [Actinorugispora endophytica]|uniref:nitric oxide dioxygenase n=1 Tax=Actinorugispora endophytica TaxID=1605990 RepID=A0A4R6UFD3_9ACTN|nr:globin domain-containing protein [Actinorugispora endophytica]TDQ45530.1 nitric oxide dioxygenase [Actinorugispora endophytica]